MIIGYVCVNTEHNDFLLYMRWRQDSSADPVFDINCRNSAINMMTIMHVTMDHE